MDVTADLRPRWLVSLVTLVVKETGWGGKASVAKVQLLTWGTLSRTTRQQLSLALSGGLSPSSLGVRFDPTVSKAIDLCIGFGLLRRLDGRRVELTDQGHSHAVGLEAEGVLAQEREYLRGIRSGARETDIARILSWESTS